MERLTFEGNFCDIALCTNTRGGSFCEDGYCSQRKVWERLKHLEDLQEQGRLVELPCRVGAPIWYIDVSIEPNDKGKWVTRYRIKATKFEYSVLDWIDTPIYFTQAEAQAAFERMEGQK